MAQVRINVGCGSSPTPGWLNLDNSATVRLANHGLIRFALEKVGLLSRQQAEFAQRSAGTIQWADAVHRIPMGDGQASVVYSSHMLEHLDRAEALSFLGEVRRVLAPGGVVRLAVPDIERLVSQYLVDKDANRFVEHTLLATSRGHSVRDRIKAAIVGPRHHLWMYDGRSLSGLLDAAGFVDVVVQEPGRTMIADPDPLDLREREEESVYVEGRRP